MDTAARVRDLLVPFLMGIHDFGVTANGAHDVVEVVSMEMTAVQTWHVLTIELYERRYVSGAGDWGPRGEHWRVRLECRGSDYRELFRDQPAWEEVRGAANMLYFRLMEWWQTRSPGGGRTADRLD